MEQTDIIKEAFNCINAYKRHRALADISRKNREIEKAQYHELKQYKLFDQLELALRAIQKGHREIMEMIDDNDETEDVTT